MYFYLSGGHGPDLKEVAAALGIQAGQSRRRIEEGQGQTLEIGLGAVAAVIVKKIIQNPGRLDPLQKKKLKKITGRLDLLLLQKKNLDLHQKKRLKKTGIVCIIIF